MLFLLLYIKINIINVDKKRIEFIIDRNILKDIMFIKPFSYIFNINSYTSLKTERKLVSVTSINIKLIEYLNLKRNTLLPPIPTTFRGPHRKASMHPT
jgi:hypothetical protein